MQFHYLSAYCKPQTESLSVFVPKLSVFLKYFLSAVFRYARTCISHGKQKSFSGGWIFCRYPYGSYLLNVTVAAPGVESVAVKALPDGAVWMELWTYRIEDDHTLSFLGTAQRNGDGTYDLPCAGTGAYLRMTQPLEDHLDEAETLRERMQGR